MPSKTLATSGGRRRKRHYPPSWGCTSDQFQWKKRVLCVYDGQHRLLKDDLMLHKDYELRIDLPSNNGHVTDLDVHSIDKALAVQRKVFNRQAKTKYEALDFQTVLRAEAIFTGPEDERRPWQPDNVLELSP